MTEPIPTVEDLEEAILEEARGHWRKRAERAENLVRALTESLGDCYSDDPAVTARAREILAQARAFLVPTTFGGAPETPEEGT